MNSQQQQTRKHFKNTWGFPSKQPLSSSQSVLNQELRFVLPFRLPRHLWKFHEDHSVKAADFCPWAKSVLNNEKPEATQPKQSRITPAIRIGHLFLKGVSASYTPDSFIILNALNRNLVSVYAWCAPLCKYPPYFDGTRAERCLVQTPGSAMGVRAATPYTLYVRECFVRHESWCNGTDQLSNKELLLVHLLRILDTRYTGNSRNQHFTSFS